MARVCEAEGADGLSLINAVQALEVDAETRRPVLLNGLGGLSGPAIRPIALRMVCQARRAVKIPICGIGGIASGEDAVEFLLCGATAVQVGTRTTSSRHRGRGRRRHRGLRRAPRRRAAARPDGRARASRSLVIGGELADAGGSTVFPSGEVEAIVFDLDGTLLRHSTAVRARDSPPGSAGSRACRGQTSSRAALCGHGDPLNYAMMLVDRARTPAIAASMDRPRETPQRSGAIRGAACRSRESSSCVAMLAERYPIGVVTNRARREAGGFLSAAVCRNTSGSSSHARTYGGSSHTRPRFGRRLAACAPGRSNARSSSATCRSTCAPHGADGRFRWGSPRACVPRTRLRRAGAAWVLESVRGCRHFSRIWRRCRPPRPSTCAPGAVLAASHRKHPTLATPPRRDPAFLDSSTRKALGCPSRARAPSDSRHVRSVAHPTQVSGGRAASRTASNPTISASPTPATA